MADNPARIVNASDNVATALRDVRVGETITITINSEDITVDILEDVKFGHKITIDPIQEGETVTKYGESIGSATEDIKPGEWVHVHNVESNYGRGDLETKTDA